MNLYDGIKDIAKIVRKADNIELYQELLELSDRARVMQVEISRLKEENSALGRKRIFQIVLFAIQNRLLLSKAQALHFITVRIVGIQIANLFNLNATIIMVLLNVLIAK